MSKRWMSWQVGLGRFGCLGKSVSREKVQVYGNRRTHSAGHIFACNCQSFMSPRNWLTLPWKPRWQGKMPFYSMSLPPFLFQPLMTTDLPTRTHSPRAQATKLRTRGRQIGFVDGGWTFSLPPDSELRLRVTLNKSLLSAYRFKVLLWTWMWHL